MRASRQHRQRLRDDMIDMVVHDMRSQLTVLIANLELVRMDAEGETAENIEEAIRGGMNLSQLVTTALDVRRLEDGKMPTTLVRTDVGALARTVARAMLALEPDREIEVIAPGETWCMCDVDLVRRVIDNLIANAIKYTPRPNAVYVSVTTVHEVVRIAVRDEGPGIPPDALACIFEKFRTAGVPAQRAYHSAGLGLAFCKLAAEAHGGSITVDSEVPHGSEFVVELPC